MSSDCACCNTCCGLITVNWTMLGFLYAPQRSMTEELLIREGFAQDCIVTEQLHPFLPQMVPYIEDDRPIYAAEGAVSQFELLLHKFGGLRERERWHAWKRRIRIVSCNGREDPSARIQALAGSSAMTEV